MPTEETTANSKLISLSELDIQKWVNSQLKDGNVAEINRDEDDNIVWDGSMTALSVLGYPYILVDKVLTDPSKNVREVFPKYQEVGLPLINLGFSPEHQGFFVVRSDVYEI